MTDPTEPQVEPQIELGPADVLYRDDAVIAVAKPPGLVSQATPDPRRDHLLAAVARYLARVDGAAAPAPVLVHRLDRDTTGVVVLSLHPDAHGVLGEAFRSREAHKTYLAVVVTAARTVAAGEAWTIDNHLRVDRRAKTPRRVLAVRSGGDRAITDVRVVAVAEAAALVEARPRTGRTHQIRVHLSDDRLPILGDTAYGGPRHLGAVRAPRVLLHAAALELPHPITGASLRLEAPVPADMARVLQRLHLGAGGQDRVAEPGNTR